MTKHENNTAIRYHRSFVAPGRALKHGPVLGPGNRDLLPLGPEPVESLQVERLEAEGQRDNNYYTLRLSNPDYQGHSCACMRA
jgi:hypothetical protein